MMPNAYLQKMAAKQNGIVDAAKHTVQQLCLDTVQIVLHEEYGWDYDKIIEFSLKWGDYYNYYFDAFALPKSKLEDERDVYRTHLDRALKEILGDRELMPFNERYPYAAQVSYEPRK